jgi:hypothetical protein
MATAPQRVLVKDSSNSYRSLSLPFAMIAIAILLYATLNTAVLGPSFSPVRFLALAVILFAAGMMSGLTGFAFSAIGALTLFLLAPITAVPLLQALSACNQMLSVGKLRPRWTPENRPMVDTSKPANGGGPGHQYL